MKTIALAICLIMCFATVAHAKDQDNAAAASDLYTTDAPVIRMPPQESVTFDFDARGHLVIFDEKGRLVDLTDLAILHEKLRRIVGRRKARRVRSQGGSK